MATVNQVKAIHNTAVKTKTVNPYWPLFIILGYYFLSILIVNPIGNFPQNDDWVYGQAAKTLCLPDNWTCPRHARLVSCMFAWAL